MLSLWQDSFIFQKCTIMNIVVSDMASTTVNPQHNIEGNAHVVQSGHLELEPDISTAVSDYDKVQCIQKWVVLMVVLFFRIQSDGLQEEAIPQPAGVGPDAAIPSALMVATRTNGLSGWIL